jgi:O-antigen ligase
LRYSRGGLLIAVIALGVTLTVGGKNAIAHAFAWFFHPPKNSTKTKIYSVGIRFIIILLAVALVFGSITFLAGQKYVSRLWTVNANSISDYFVKTSAGGRFTYLWAEWQLFVAHPVLGTGLGSSGLYLYQYFPDWALYNNPEITQHLSPTSSLYPNSKNLYLRLLAETGIIGFSIFMAFLSGILAKIGYFLLRPQYKLAGIAGLFSFVAVVTYYLMQDSFAMAELWINFGILLGLSAGTLEESAKESFRLNV